MQGNGSIRRNAFEIRLEYDNKGLCRKREVYIGSIVPWSIVALVTLACGKALVNIPPSFWDFFKR
jgi:hypothetical protein